MPLYHTACNGTTTGITTQYVWPSWCDQSTAGTTSSLTIEYARPVWVGASLGTTTVVLDPMDITGWVDTRTIEERVAEEARFQARLDAQVRRSVERAEAKRMASQRARALLDEILDREQRAQLLRDQCFEVVAPGSRRRYRIRHGTHGNVRLLDAQGREVTQDRAQPLDVPTEDAMLAQLLQIRHDEAGFLRVANATRVA